MKKNYLLQMAKNILLVMKWRKMFSLLSIKENILFVIKWRKCIFWCQIKNVMLIVFKWIKKISISQNDEKYILCYERNKKYFLFTKLRIRISFLSIKDFILSSLLNQEWFDAKCIKIVTLLSNEEHIFQVTKRRGSISLSLKEGKYCHCY